jgi:hypothetical protein
MLGVRGGAFNWGTVLQAKVMCSIPYDVTGIYQWHHPSDRTMALGLTQSLTEMSTTNNSCGVKAEGT